MQPTISITKWMAASKSDPKPIWSSPTKLLIWSIASSTSVMSANGFLSFISDSLYSITWDSEISYLFFNLHFSTSELISLNNKLELIWTVVPTIVLTGVIIFGLRTWDRAMNADVTDATVIEVYSKQFQWTARVSGDDNKLGKANYKFVTGKNSLGVDMEDKNAADDKLVREVHLVVDKPVLLKFRSQDVIHSAFLPHFRVQMNCVPGLSTQFAFTPTQTTSEMKEQEGDDFEYVLLCNNIIGNILFRIHN